jgi:hypothetical protein
MQPQSEITPYLIIAGVLLVPAIIFFAAFTFVRRRRSRFRHQRRSPHSKSDG